MLKSIRVRLTLWYLCVFGALLIVFSAYIYSFVSRDMRKRFDASILRNAQAMASYFTEFAERKNVEAGAKETVKETVKPAVTPAVAPTPVKVPDLTAVLWPLTTLNRRPESSRRPEPPRAPRRRGIDVGAVITRALTAAGLMK